MIPFNLDSWPEHTMDPGREVRGVQGRLMLFWNNKVHSQEQAVSWAGEWGRTASSGRCDRGVSSYNAIT